MSEDLKKALERVKTKEQLNDVVLRFQNDIKKLSKEEQDMVLGGFSSPEDFDAPTSRAIPR